MSCPEQPGCWDAFLDDELEVLRAAELAEHARECPRCRAILADYQKIREGLRHPDLYFRMPPGLLKKLPTRRARPWPWLGLAAALLLLALGGWWRWGRGELEQRAVEAHVRSLMAQHLEDVASTDQHTVKPWFAGRLPFAPVVVDLAAQGFPLSGGRLDTLGEEPAAGLVYRRHQHVLNLLEIADSGPARGPQRFSLRGYHGVRWRDGQLAYLLVSDLNAKELDDFVALYLKALE